ncbi:hypothetical protein HN51_027559 [Arachis hypogaea]
MKLVARQCSQEHVMNPRRRRWLGHSPFSHFPPSPRHPPQLSPFILLWGLPTSTRPPSPELLSTPSPSPIYCVVSLFAVISGAKDVRDAVDEAKKLRMKSNPKTVSTYG